MTRFPAPPRRPARALALVAGLLIAVAACGPAVPSLSPTPASPTATPAATPAAPSEVAAVYARIAAQVEAIRGLHPTTAIAPVLIDEVQLRANLTADFDAQNPKVAIETSERILTALGLLKAGTSLRDAYLDLQSGQVAGYYSPERDELFVVSRAGGVGATQKVTYAHEFTHQLQDQTFDLDSLELDALDQGDRGLARLALVEGDASNAQTAWMLANLTPEELGQVFADSSDPATLAALQRAPAILRDTAFFPYTEGLTFVKVLEASGGQAAVDKAFADPPDSTEQILHPEKYATRERPIPILVATDVAAAMGAGWSASGSDTLGELILRVWLRQGGVAAAAAEAAAAGWGGDRIELLIGPNGEVDLAIETAWDSEADADAFAAAAQSAIAGLGLTGEVRRDGDSPRVSMALGAEAADVITLLGGSTSGV